MNTSFWYTKLKVVVFLGKSKFLQAVELTQELLDDFIFKCESRTKPTYFSREGGRNKLDFKTIMIFMLNFVKKSLKHELDEFFDKFYNDHIGITKQAFTAARRKIKPEAFQRLYQTIVDWFYSETKFKTFLGYRLCAIDGSVFEINNSQRLRDTFGASKGNSIELARAMASTLYDIENNMIIRGIITKYTAGERDVAKELIGQVPKNELKNILLLFDRGYPAIKFFMDLIDSGAKFVIRIPVNNYKDRMNPALPDQIVTFKEKNGVIHLRAIRFKLDSGLEEILFTNLFDESLDVEAFKALYFKRWGVECKYQSLKNKLGIESFTGDTQQIVEQDFYASLYLANMASLIKQETDENITQENKDKDLKYEYQTNENILIGKLKNRLIAIILEKKPRKRRKLYKKLLESMENVDKVPKRTGRKNKRRKGERANKHCWNYRPCV